MLVFPNLSVILLFFVVQSTISKPGPFDKKACSLPAVDGTPENTTTKSSTTNLAATSNTANTTNSEKPTNPANSIEDDTDNEIELPETITLRSPQKCNAARQCKAACGSRASSYECISGTGNCLCNRRNGPAIRCRGVKHNEEFCDSICAGKIAQICYTEFGNFCTCFLYQD